ncbi:MAG: hypothetical protein GXX96_22790 [Planctomycetaceae bacterium]|nr:hypothetical protein [Planctomycetaceae bacterium]
MRKTHDQKTAAPVAFKAALRILLLTAGLAVLAGCGRSEPQATVEGTLKLNDRPLDNCLVTFFPEAGSGDEVAHSTGLTDEQGRYRLRHVDQREGAAVGSHRVTVQDLSVSSGIRRRDHGTVDMEEDPGEPPPRVRRSRVRESYGSPASTPLRVDVKPGCQTIDLKVE